MPGYGVNGRACSARLQGNDGRLLPGRRRGHIQKRDDLALPVPQLVAKLRRQRASWGVAPQPVALYPDLDVLGREACEKLRNLHQVR